MNELPEPEPEPGGPPHVRTVFPLLDAGAELRLRPLAPLDRAPVRTLLEATGFFREDEVQVALEVLDSYFTHPGQDYTATGAFTLAGSLLGYLCYGPAPCTLGTWDLYWIAVSPTAQRRGIGALLLQEMERRLALTDARLVVVETSSRPDYAPTRAFYRRMGYDEVARVPDFYAPGDGKVILARRIQD